MAGLVDKVFRQLQLITRLVHLLIYLFFATFAFVNYSFSFAVSSFTRLVLHQEPILIIVRIIIYN